jgi:hypothetical protein
MAGTITKRRFLTSGAALCLYTPAIHIARATQFEVNAVDYGLVSGVNTLAQAQANANAIISAFNVAPRVFLPDGKIVYIQDFVVPLAGKKLFGAAMLIPAGTITNPALVNVRGNSGFVLEDVTVSVPPTVGGTTGVFVNNATGTELRRVSATGQFGIVVQNSTDSLLDHCSVPDYGHRGYYIPGCIKIRVRDSECANVSAIGDHAFSAEGSNEVYISRCRATRSGAFGFSLDRVDYAEIDGCTSTDSVLEGVQLTATRWASVTGNRCVFPGVGGQASTDFGMSLNGSGGQCDVISITGNEIDFPHKSCLAIASDRTGEASRVVVTGNVFSGACAQGTDGDFLPYHPAVVLYGPNTTRCVVAGNTIRSLNGFMNVKVIEAAAGGSPNMNELGPNDASQPGVTDFVVLGPQSKGYSS